MEVLIGIISMVLLYFLGHQLFPDAPKHKTIEQERIKMEDE
jgi:hypothetical protein